MTFCSCNVLNVNPLKCVLMNNQKCKIRPQIININSNNPLFYPYSIEINECSASCKNFNDPHANFKEFDLVSRTNETRHIECMKLASVNVD